jgi:hypothetical protein
MKTLAKLMIFLFLNNLTWAKEINCTNFDNNKVRCLAKKRCRWIDAPGANVDKGLCTYKDIPENQAEMLKYKQVLIDKEKCMKALIQYDTDREMKVRAEVTNDTTSAQYQQERMNKQLAIITSIDGCADVGEELNVKVDKNQEAPPIEAKIEEAEE